MVCEYLSEHAMTLLSLAAAFLAGVLLASRLDVAVAALWLFAVASILVLGLPVSVRRPLLPGVLLLVLILGALRVEVFESDLPPELTAYHSPRVLKLQGTVVGDPEAAGASTRLRLRVDGIKPDDAWIEASGDVLVTLRESSEIASLRKKPYFRYGDKLLLEGALQAPPVFEDFYYSAYLARQGITSVMSFPEGTLVGEGGGVAFYRWLYGVRQSLAASLTRTVPEPQASLGQALMLGLRDNLPEDMVEDFQRTGTSHILAISGLHVGILMGITLIISRWVFGRRHQIYLVLPLVMIWLYALISGMSPSVTRAAIMGSVYLAALFVGRPRSVLPALGLAAAAMVAINPNVLWSVSFQLSFAAMAGIALLATPLSQRLQSLYRGRRSQGSGGSRADTGILSPILTPLSDSVAMTIAATVTTLPLVAFYFERISLVGIPTTALGLTALPFILVAQAITALLGLFSIGLAQPFGWVAWVATSYLTGLVGLFARIPGASVDTGDLGILLVWAYYGAFVLLYVRAPLRRQLRRLLAYASVSSEWEALTSKSVSWWIIVPIISLAALAWIAALSLPDSRLKVAFVDVGQGDAAFISTPGGQQVLVDGGPDPLAMVRFLGDKMPFRDRTIELIVLTHPHSDHVTGLLEVLRRYDVQRVLERGIEYDSPPYQAWRRALTEENAEIIRAQAGQVIALGDGVFIHVVSPPASLLRGTASDVDNASVVLRLVYGDFSFLLTGDMFNEAEAALVAQNAPIDSDVLKVGHHGSRSSSTAAFLEKVSPAIAVIAAGQDNRFGHPHPEVVESLRQHVPQDLLFMTKDNGTIEFISDGRNLEIKMER